MGYLLRLSEENCFETPFSLLELGELKASLPKNIKSITDSDQDKKTQDDLGKLSPKSGINDYVKKLVSGEIDLSKLAHITGEIADVLESLRYPIVHSTLDHYPDIHDFYFYDVPSNFLRFAYPRVCVECLNETPYHRAVWDFAPMTSCPAHNSLLIDICPACNQQLAWNRCSITKCQCGSDLLQLSPTKLDSNQTWLSHEVQALVNYTAADPMINNSYHTATRRFSDLIDVIELIRKQSNRLSDSARKHFRYEFQWQPNAELHETLLYLVINLETKKPILDKPHTDDSHTLSARRLGLKDSHSNKSVRKEIFTETHSSFNRQRELISKSALCSQLGISPRLMHGLEEFSIIKPVTGPKIDKSGDYHYAKTEVIEILSKLKSLSKTSEKPHISINHHLRSSAVKLKRPFGLIIQSLLENKAQFYFPEGFSLLKIQLEELSFNSFLQETEPAVINDGFLSVKAAAEKLNIYNDAVYRSLKAGIIPHTTRGRTKLIRSLDLEKFNHYYVFVTEIAKTHGCNPTNLADKIIDEGIKPASGPNVDGNLLNVFLRSDINKLDMHHIINKIKYDTNTGRKSKQTRKKSYLELVEILNLVPSTEAANILGVSIQQLSKLVRKNYLKIEKHSSIPAYKKYIRLTEIEEYEARYKSNPNLVSKSYAANFLNESETRFYNNWVKYKRLELVNDGLDNDYVDKKAIEEIKEFKKQALSTAEACAVLGVKKYEIDNLRKLGKLIPVSGPGVDPYGNYFYKKKDIETLSNADWW